jgi:hypothetical protein
MMVLLTWLWCDVEPVARNRRAAPTLQPIKFRPCPTKGFLDKAAKICRDCRVHDFEPQATPLVKTIALRALAGLFCFLLMRAGAEGVSDLLQQGVSAQHAVVPLYPTGSLKLAAIVRVDRAFLDYQRKGFFRLGMFPVGVLDGVTIEAQDKANPLASLDCIRHWLATKTGQRIEMRRFKFLFSPTNRVEAGLARCVAQDHWELLNGVRFISGAGEIRAPKAILQMAGPRSGQVIMETTPRSTNTFLTSALALQDSSHPAK